MERGAAAVVAGREVRGLLRGTPVVLMPDVPDALSRLAVAFYNAPYEKMTVIGVVGALPHTASREGGVRILLSFWCDHRALSGDDWLL